MRLSDLSLILVSVALSASGQLLLKLGASAPAVRGAIAGGAPGERLLALATTPALVGGLMVYALSAAAWIVVLSKLDLSLAYPFVGLGFVVTFLIGVLLLGEPASAGRLAGTLLIAGGAVLVARG